MNYGISTLRRSGGLTLDGQRTNDIFEDAEPIESRRPKYQQKTLGRQQDTEAEQ